MLLDLPESVSVSCNPLMVSRAAVQWLRLSSFAGVCLVRQDDNP